MEPKKRRWFPWLNKRGIDREIQEIIDQIPQRPNDPRLHQRLAELHLERGRKDQAVEEFVKAAECHSEAGFNLRAIALYRRILRMQGDSQEILLRLAELYLVNGLFGDALAQLRKVIRRCREEGRPEETVGVLRRMGEADPTNLEVQIKFAELLKTEGLFAEALDESIRLYGVFQSSGPADLLAVLQDEIHTLYGKIKKTFLEKGNEEALRTLEQRIQAMEAGEASAPPPVDSQEASGIAFEDEDIFEDEEISELEDVFDAEQISELAGVVDDQEIPEFEDAAEIGRIAAEQGGAPSGSILEMLQEARLYAEQGLFSEAEEIFRAILEQEPRQTEALIGLEEIERERQRMFPRTDPAKSLQDSGLQGRPKRSADAPSEGGGPSSSDAGPPEDAQVHFELGLAYLELGLVDECIEELHLSSMDPALAFVSHRQLGDCYRRKGDLQRGILHLRKALKCGGGPAREILDVSYELAQTLEQSGLKEQALLLYQKIGEKNSGFRDVEERVRSLSQ